MENELQTDESIQARLCSLEEKVSFLDRMVTISQMLNSTLDQRKLLALITQTSIEMLKAEEASIMLVDERSGELFFVTATGSAQEELRKIKVPMDSSIAGAIVKSGEPMIVADVSKDPRHYSGVDQSISFETHAILGVPLKVRDRCIGVLEVINKRNGEPFNDEDAEILRPLASQAAVAIDNVRLISRLRDANRRLAELDRLKSNFISIASHELRTPLMVVLGYASFLREHSSSDTVDEAEMVLKGARQLQGVIDQITNLSYLEHGLSELEKKPLVLQNVIADVCRQWQTLADSKSLTLRQSFPEIPIIVSADRTKISLVLGNLLSNAVSFTPKGGRIEVNIRPHTGMVAISVVDTGIGIPKDKLNQIFDRFYQIEDHLTRHHEGLGVGLSISKEIVEQHDGRIWAESVLGHGSRFTFMLPIRWEEAEDRKAGANAGE